MQSTISRELAHALASMHGEASEVVEGQPGRGFPTVLNLPGTEVIGHVNYGGRSITFVVARSADHRNLQLRIEHALRQDGFSLPEAPRRGGFAGGGSGNFALFSRHDCSVTLTAGSALTEGILVNVAVGPPIPPQHQNHRALMSSRGHMAIPEFSEPSGVRQYEQGGGGSGSFQYTGAKLISSGTGAIDIAAVGAHHSKDLSSCGWKQLGIDVGAGHLIATFVLLQDNQAHAGLYTLSQLAKRSEAIVQFVLNPLSGENQESGESGGSWGMTCIQTS